MYCLTEQQMDFILDDIRARGVEMESLQQDILDHVCCIIEQNLEENGDFRSFYYSTIKTFYKKELREIEEETISLLTNKHYYTMKKLMIYSGIFSALVFCMGIILKFMYLPGASACIVLGIISLSFVFLPLMFALKMKEAQKVKDKLLVGLGILSAILITLSVLFKVQYWPGANFMGMLAIVLIGLVFLPIYLVTGIKQPETRVNTIVTSVFIVSGCCLLLTLVVSSWGMKTIEIGYTRTYLRNEQLLKNEQKLVTKELKHDTANVVPLSLSNKIMGCCEDLKSRILMYETGLTAIDTDFAGKDVRIRNYFTNYDTLLLGKIRGLEKQAEEYNGATAKLSNPDLLSIPIKSTFLEKEGGRSLETLSDIFRVQMIVLQNERALADAK